MKIAINPCLWNSHGKFHDTKHPWDTFVSEAAEAGYDGVELDGNEDTLGSVESVQKRLQELKLAWPASASSVTAEPHQPNIDKYQKDLRFSHAAGKDLIMVCGGFLGRGRKDLTPSDYDTFGESLRLMIDYAGNLGQCIAYHPHRGCLVENCEETQWMIDRVPDLKLCMDIAHLAACKADIFEFIDRFHERIVYTHIKDYSWAKNSFVELGEGDADIDIAGCIAALKKHGYDGWLTVELDKKAWEGDERSTLDSAKQCADYLRSTM